MQVEALTNILPRHLVSRGRKSHEGGTAKGFAERTQLDIFRTEVVAPLTYTVCLVNSYQTDRQSSE